MLSEALSWYLVEMIDSFLVKVHTFYKGRNIYTYVCTHVHIQTYIHTHIYTYTNIYIHLFSRSAYFKMYINAYIV